ncbi:Retrovirus-related Pol polyprotein from transposon [Trichinella nativa]|uniref:Retrovirus-related Pol polyprotein from transposon n=1 Tax=Trichinella nativa TaxID=6335 RepID=A0A0V1L427_9BILA|nr:Retrovirus-related Pol polyprotein from transposon [Trichinella nativa]
MADATSDKSQMDNVQATMLGLSLPSSFEDGDFKRWLLHFEVCAEANGWSDTIKAKKLPTFLKGDALIIFLDCPAAVKSNYKLLIGALKSKLNPKASQVAAFDEFQKATLMTGESMRSFAHRLQLLLDRACVTEDKMTNTTLLLRRFISGLPKNYSRQLMTGAELTSLDEAVDRAQLLASVDGQLDTQTMATTHEMSALIEEMKRKIDNLADRIDQTAIHNQAQGAAVRPTVTVTLLELRKNRSPSTELPFWKAFKLDRPRRSGPPSWATELKGPSFRYPQQPSSSTPHWVGATQCNGPACNCYGVVGGYRARILFDSGSTISLICKNLLSLTNCDKNISACDVVLLTASGEEVNPRNSVTLPLQLGSFDGRHHFVVMDSLLTDVILGTDFMTKYGICIDLGGRKIFGPSLGEIHILADNPAQSCGVGNESENENSDHDDEACICAIPNSKRQSQHLDLPSCAETYQNIVSSFKNIFRTTPGLTSVIEHQIWTVGSPIKVPPRRVPEAFRADVEKQLQEMLKQGIIEPSNSPWMAPALYTPKKSGEVRICVDYRELNKKTRKDAYPLSLPDDIFDKVRRAAVLHYITLQ